MDLGRKGSAAVFLLLAVFTLSKFSEAQKLCSGPSLTVIKENNDLNDVVAVITTDQDEVTARITSQKPDGFFGLDGFNLVANVVLDYETFNKTDPYVVNVECTKPGVQPTTLVLRIIVQDVNDNPPVFAQSQYTIEVPELTTVGTSVGQITATDPDESDQLYYRLDSPEGEFELESNFRPNILVKKLLDYDKVKQVTMTLYTQDTEIGSPAEVSHTALTTVVVNILDIDNRPPWFQPCTEVEFATSKACLNSGYEGTIKLNTQETEPLTLKPGPVLAIDGDNGRNEVIGYTFLGGVGEDLIFAINDDTGSITMLKPYGEAGPVVLTVMAYQKLNADQFATTTVILKVVETSNFPPKFVKPSYEGFISEDAGVDSLVLESKTSNRPLRVQATDEDFSNGYNPNLRFEIDGTDLSITPEGFILMAKTVSPGTVDLQMRVVDTTNEESNTATLTVEVTPGIPTTTSVTSITTSSIITTDNTINTPSTSHPATNTTTTPSTAGQLGRSGEYSTEDMAALGATLAVLVLLCLVSIGLMAHHIKGHKADWKKLSEASVFRSTLGGGSGGPKDGVQFSNEGFQHDGDSGSMNSKLAADLEKKLESGLKPRGSAQQKATPSAFLQTSGSPAPDSSSLADSETVDGEKEVKPILTKERRNEDGYKAVWFKQDIDPNTKEEVVIIPDTGETDGDLEEEDDTEDEDDLRTDLDLEDDERLTSM